MAFVICMEFICGYFVRYGSCICILCETWSLEIYEKYVWELYIDTLLDMDLLYIYIYIHFERHGI